MKYYVLIGTFVENSTTGDEMKQAIDAHLKYLQSYFENGSILMSGPKASGGGGIILVKTDDIQKFCNDDPLVKIGIQQYQIVEFHLHDCQEQIKQWFEN